VVKQAISLDITTVASGGAAHEACMDRAVAQRLLAADADADDR
jgi:hypothetical protein